MINHLNKKYLYLNKKLKLNENDKILDIGSNDSTFLNFSNSKKYGVDPYVKNI